MPVLDGYEITQQIKMTAKGKATKIVVLTVSAFDSEIEKVFSVGKDDYLSKPFCMIRLNCSKRRHL